MGALEGLGSHILDTFVKSEGWLWRFGRVLSAAGAPRRGAGSPKGMRKRYKILLKRVSVTVSGPDLVFLAFFDSFRSWSLQ